MEKIARTLFSKNLGFLLLAAVLATTCATPPDFPVEPVIEFVGLSKDTLRRGSVQTDTTFITFSFTDGDGDIGSDSIQLFVIDSGDDDSTPIPYRIPFVPELGASNGIKGEITFRLFNRCCIFPEELFLDGCNDVLNTMPYEQITYDVYIKDRAGHVSNTITTTPIWIRCF